MPQEKQGWDTRAWLVGILGGTGGGILSAWSVYPPSAKRINAVMHSATAADWIFGVSVSLSLLVLPGLLSGIARRRTFLWGLLPLVLVVTVSNLESRITKGLSFIVVDAWPAFAVLGGCWLIASGPVSLFRFGQVRTRRKREAAAASLVAQRVAASVPQDGVWPPPPEYRQ